MGMTGSDAVPVVLWFEAHMCQGPMATTEGCGPRQRFDWRYYTTINREDLEILHITQQSTVINTAQNTAKNTAKNTACLDLEILNNPLVITLHKSTVQFQIWSC